MKYHSKTKDIQMPHHFAQDLHSGNMILNSRVQQCDLILDENDTVVAVISDITLTQNILYFLNQPK